MQSLAQYHIAEQTWLKESGPRNGTAPARLDGTVKPDPDAGPWEPAVVKIVEFQHLGDDWDGQGARAPSHELLASAIGLAYTLKDQGALYAEVMMLEPGQPARHWTLPTE
jgi:hypothetical protein